MRPTELFELNDPIAANLFEDVGAVWSLIPRLEEKLDDLLRGRHVVHGTVDPGAFVGSGPLYIGHGARVEAGAMVTTPCFIGDGVVIRHGAYIRSNCIFLEASVLGHASEAKNSLFLDRAKAPHFAYVGDSILGNRVNLGAGTKLSNVPVTHLGGGPRPTIAVVVDGITYDTHLSKFGAILGDDVSIGCNSVTNPGVIIGPRTMVYPNSVISRGFHMGDTVIKTRQQVEIVERYD